MTRPTLGEMFVTQNPLSAADLDIEDIEAFAEHYAGGLVVLAGYPQREHFYVKMHDSWSDTHDIVVHEYHMDDPEQQTERYFQSSQAAFACFLQQLGAGSESS